MEWYKWSQVRQLGETADRKAGAGITHDEPAGPFRARKEASAQRLTTVTRV